MRRYIDADLYIDYLTELRESAKKHFKYEEAYSLGLEINRIKCFPSVADVAEVKHGKWIEHPHFNFEGGYSGADYECSMCGYSDCVYEEYSYCPNCGAKMDKE